MPVYDTEETYEQARQQAEIVYKQSAPAAALIYQGGGVRDFIGVRIESIELNKEFVSNIPFGRGMSCIESLLCIWIDS